MLQFSPEHYPKICLWCNRLVKGTTLPLSVGFQVDKTLVWESCCVVAGFTISCTLLLKHLVLATVGHRMLEEEHGPRTALTMLFH